MHGPDLVLIAEIKKKAENMVRPVYHVQVFNS